MTLALLGFLALATAQAPVPPVFSYRTPDGIDHYVGSEDDLPNAYRKAAKRMDLSKVPLNSETAKGWHAAASEPAPEIVGKPTDLETRSPPEETAPTVYAILAAILLCVFPALLISWLRAPRARIAILVLAIGDLALGLFLGLSATHSLRPRGAEDLDLNPLHAIDNARRARDQINRQRAREEKETEEMLTERPAPKPKATAKPPAAPAPAAPTYDPSAPGTPVRRVIKPPGWQPEP